MKTVLDVQEELRINEMTEVKNLGGGSGGKLGRFAVTQWGFIKRPVYRLRTEIDLSHMGDGFR